MITVEILDEKPIEVAVCDEIVVKETIPDGYYRIEGTKTITENGTHNVGDYEFAEVKVPERKEEQEATVNITKNGTTEIFPDENKVLSKATVNVNVPIPDGYIKPEGSMPITENGTFDVREKAEVNVQVVAKPEKPYIDSSKLKCGNYMFSNTYGTDLSLLQNLDTSEMIITECMLENRRDLIEVPNHLNFEKITSGLRCFAGCSNMAGKVIFNLPKCTSLQGFLMYCSNVSEVYLSNTGLVQKWQSFANGCTALETVGELDMSSATDYNYAFSNCKKLTNISFSAINVYGNNLNFSQCTNLSVESLLSILNALSDNTGLTTTYTVTLGSANLAKLTGEQLEIAYNKNILLQ